MYRTHQFDVPVLGDTMYIRFDAEMTSRRDYWFVDDVQIFAKTFSGPPNGLPIANDDSYGTNEGAALNVPSSAGVLANDSDPENESLIAVLEAGPAHGSVSLGTDGSFTYTPDVNFNGIDSFAYRANDGTHSGNVGTVSIVVNSVNDDPVAADDSYSIAQDATLIVPAATGVLDNDADVDGDPLDAVLQSGPLNGTLVLSADGAFSYTPDPGFSGADSFAYTADDGTTTSNAATVSILVNAASAGPNLAHGIVTGVGNSWQTVTLPNSFSSMVVIATPRYNVWSGPGAVRIQNANGGNAFDVRVDNVGSSPFSGDVHYIVVEEGVYDESGYKLEAVRYNSTVTDENNSWVGESVSYQQSYVSPVVVGQVMTANDDDWSVFWASGSSRTAAPSSTALTIGKHVGEDADVARANETIGYLVIEATGSGTIEGLPFVAGVGADIVRGVENAPAYQYSYAPMPNAKTAVGSQAGMDGGDGGWAVLFGSNPLPASAGTIDLAIDEDQLGNSERKHTTEQVAYFIIDPPAAPLDNVAIQPVAAEGGFAKTFVENDSSPIFFEPLVDFQSHAAEESRSSDLLWTVRRDRQLVPVDLHEDSGQLVTSAATLRPPVRSGFDGIDELENLFDLFSRLGHEDWSLPSELIAGLAAASRA